jgi:NAD(P)-dependent dehydrogenase (short-subunit alcohol dehydrogenase family)
LTSSTPGVSLSDTAAAVRELGRCLPLTADLLAPGGVTTVADVPLSEFGRVSILVNDAAVLTPEVYESFWDMSESSWRNQIELNRRVPKADGHLIGAVGISGDTSDNDEARDLPVRFLRTGTSGISNSGNPKLIHRISCRQGEARRRIRARRRGGARTRVVVRRRRPGRHARRPAGSAVSRSIRFSGGGSLRMPGADARVPGAHPVPGYRSVCA